MCRDGKSGPEKVTAGSCGVKEFNPSLMYRYLDPGLLESTASWESSAPKD